MIIFGLQKKHVCSFSNLRGMTMKSGKNDWQSGTLKNKILRKNHSK